MKPGDNGRASIDSNFQYGCKEYYQYQNTKKQTSVVDENDLYKNYDYEWKKYLLAYFYENLP